jgi:succinoglycan biosynthesis transport protein ExoP
VSYAPRDTPARPSGYEPDRYGDPRRPEGGTWPRPSHVPPYAELEPAAPWRSTMSSLFEVLAILRRRWLRVVVTCAIVVLATVLGVSLLEPQYRAEVSLLLQPSGPEVLDEVEGIEEQLDANTYRNYYRTQHEIISSRTVAAEALDRLGLADDPAFLGVDDIEDEDERAAVIAELDPVEALRELIDIREVHDSRVVRVRVEYSDPELAREIANTIAQAYVDHVSGERSDTGARAAGDLDKERALARERLREAERALDAFKAEHEITTIALEDRQSVVTQNIIELSARTKAAQAATFEAKNLYEQARKLHRRGVSAGAAALLRPSERNIFDHLLTERLAAEAEFHKIDLEYGPRHPAWKEAKQRLDLLEKTTKDEAGGHLATFEARYAAAHATQKQLAAELERERKRALELTRLEPSFRELARDVSDAEEIYAVLSRRDTEVELTNRVEDEPPVRILDPATTPRKPVRPRVLLCVAAAIFVGLLLGAVQAVAVDMRDHTLRGLRDAEQAVAGWDIAVLGQLPKLPPDPALGPANLRAQRLQRDLQTHRRPQSPMAERTRKLRAAIGFGLGKQRCPVLLVTSPASSEGKSSTALNLALSWCQAGKRVLLVDADMRRPRLHEVFPAVVDAPDLGLAAVLAGECELDEAIELAPSGAPEELAILRCGPIPETPAELLDSHAFLRTLAKLRERFEIVIIDSPPVLPVVDALLIARQVDGVVLVARAGATSQHDVQQSLSLLRQRDTNLLGLVLNDVDLRREQGRYGGEYYRYEARA